MSFHLLSRLRKEDQKEISKAYTVSDLVQGEPAYAQISEITPNNFIKGINRRLTPEELRDILSIQKIRLSDRVNHEEKPQYILCFYNSAGQEIGAIYMGFDQKLFCDDDRVIVSDKLTQRMLALKDS